MADLLFGSGVRMDGPWVSHLNAAATVGFWTTARKVPRLTLFALNTAWLADRRALSAAVLAQLVPAALGAFGLPAINGLLVGLLSAGPTPERVWAALPSLLYFGGAAAGGALARALGAAASGRLTPKVQRLAEQRLLERVAQVELRC